MGTRRTLAVLLLCLNSLLLSAALGPGIPVNSNSPSGIPGLPGLPGRGQVPNTNSSAAANCTDFSSENGATYPSCWDELGMGQYISGWNSTAQACENGEIWSTCFLRLAYGSAGYDCSRIGSLNCTGPQLGGPVTDAHIFYGAYNIYAINTYLTTWNNVLYALNSQPAISEIVLTLSAPGTPRLTVTTLLSAIITQYGLNAATDEALVDILPIDLTPLDTTVTYYSTQLATFLAGFLQSIMSEKGKLGFMFLARGGKMMGYSNESEKRLRANMAGSGVTWAATEASGENVDGSRDD